MKDFSRTPQENSSNWCRIIESSGGLGWEAPQRSSSSYPLPWEGTPHIDKVAQSTVTPWFLSPSFCLWSPGRPEQSLWIRSPATFKSFWFDQKKYFCRRGTALWGKSSPSVWGRSGAEPHFPGTTEIILVISQSCSTILRRAIYCHYMYLYRVIVSAHKHFTGNRKPDLPCFVSSESPIWGWSQEVPTFPITGNGIHLRHVNLGKEEEEGRERLDKGWGRFVYLLRQKFFKPRVTHRSPEVHSPTGEGLGWRGDIHTHSQLITGSLQSCNHKEGSLG